jgi:2-oxoglutarate dehydrogenase E1 component
MINKLFKKKFKNIQKFLINTTQKSTGHFLKESFASGNSISYLEKIERQWEQNPSSVDPKWSEYFNSIKNFQPNLPEETFYIKSEGSEKDIETKSNLINLVSAYQNLGHCVADLCPRNIHSLK